MAWAIPNDLAEMSSPTQMSAQKLVGFVARLENWAVNTANEMTRSVLGRKQSGWSPFANAHKNRESLNFCEAVSASIFVCWLFVWFHIAKSRTLEFIDICILLASRTSSFCHFCLYLWRWRWVLDEKPIYSSGFARPAHIITCFGHNNNDNNTI